MINLLELIMFASIGSFISMIAAILLLSNKVTAILTEQWAAPFAAGVLLSAAFVSLLPELLFYYEGDSSEVGQVILIGVLVFFLFERFVRYFHHHHEHESDDDKSVNRWLVITGDTIHNFLDGIAIGAAFSVDYSLGVVTTIAVAFHEIPQEIGDFGLLLKSGMSRAKVLIVNITSALSTVIGAVIIWQFSDKLADGLIAMLIGLTMGSFIYIALSDIIPSIHSNQSKNRANIETLLVFLGATIIIALNSVLEAYLA